MALFEFVKYKYPNSTTLHVPFKLNAERSNVQRVNTPTYTTLITTADILYGLNFFNYMIYMPLKYVSMLNYCKTPSIYPSTYKVIFPYVLVKGIVLF